MFFIILTPILSFLTGQGHSLKSYRTMDERMPSDLACAGHKPQARGIHDLCHTPGVNSDTITEEPEDMQVEDTGMETQCLSHIVLLTSVAKP